MWDWRWAYTWDDQLTVLNFPEDARTYSSAQDTTWHKQSMLDSHTAWSTWPQRDLQWLQIDLGKPYTVRGVFVQGRGDEPWRQQFVTKFGVQVSMDAIAWTPWAAATGVTNSLGNHEFDGPTRAVGGLRRERPTCCMFQGAGWITRYVRIVPIDWSRSRRRHGAAHNPISMRAAVLAECRPIEVQQWWLQTNLNAGIDCSVCY